MLAQHFFIIAYALFWRTRSQIVDIKKNVNEGQVASPVTTASIRNFGSVRNVLAWRRSLMALERK